MSRHKYNPVSYFHVLIIIYLQSSVDCTTFIDIKILFSQECIKLFGLKVLRIVYGETLFHIFFIFRHV